MSPVESEAQKLLEAAYERRKPEILKLPDERRAAYRRIMQTSRDFKATEPSIPDPLRIKTDKGAVAYEDHLFVPEKGEFKAALNAWEATVLAAARDVSGFADKQLKLPERGELVLVLAKGVERDQSERRASSIECSNTRKAAPACNSCRFVLIEYYKCIPRAIQADRVRCPPLGKNLSK